MGIAFVHVGEDVKKVSYGESKKCRDHNKAWLIPLCLRCFGKIGVPVGTLSIPSVAPKCYCGAASQNRANRCAQAGRARASWRSRLGVGALSAPAGADADADAAASGCALASARVWAWTSRCAIAMSASMLP